MQCSQGSDEVITKKKLFVLVKVLRQYYKSIEVKDEVTKLHKHNIKQKISVLNKVINSIDNLIKFYDKKNNGGLKENGNRTD